MSLAREILPILPRLRRFGHMLIGSREEADRSVRTCLQGLVDGSIKLDRTQDTAVAVFAILVGVLKTAQQDQKPGDAETGEKTLADELLLGLDLSERQAFLLRHIEAFSREESAQIMGLSKQGFDDLEAQTKRKLSMPK